MMMTINYDISWRLCIIIYNDAAAATAAADDDGLGGLGWERGGSEDSGGGCED